MMAHVHTGRDEIVVAGYLHPEYLEVLRAFSDGRGIKVRKGTAPGPKTAAVIFQQPDFLGLLVDAKTLTEGAHAAGALAIACVDPISLAIVAPPGQYGADIAVGEGQQLGLSPSYGGPHVGFISCRKELVRRLPGRLVGTAYDKQGRRGFNLALAAREQHIRREKATSNICTNHSLCALAASVYMTYMGPDGMRQVAEVGFKRAHALAERLAALPGWEPAFPDRQFLNEFPMRVPKGPAVIRKLARKGILGPLDVHRWFRELKGVLTFTCTEVNDSRALDELVAALES
jgi:glycine dehydrogenase subunit 1